MKNVFYVLIILAIEPMIACDLTAPVDTGNSVEVVMGGTVLRS